MLLNLQPKEEEVASKEPEVPVTEEKTEATNSATTQEDDGFDDLPF